MLWRSIAVADGDLIAFVDSDLIDPDPMFVPKMLGPLLMNRDIHLVKGYYRRPLKTGGSSDPNGGGRVTELVARPLLASQKPDLTAVLQPLGGEYAGTRELLSSVPFAPGWGEIGLLIDTYDKYGLQRYRAGQPGRAHAPQQAADRARRHEPADRRHLHAALWIRRLQRRSDQFTAEPDGTFSPHTTDVPGGSSADEHHPPGSGR